MAAAVFSLLINILYLAPTLYMLQVYDRVVPTAGKTTLLFVTMALALALLTLSILDMVRNRLLIRASQRIDALARAADPQTDDGDGFGRGRPGHARLRFRSARRSATPTIAAMFDAPWTPVFLLSPSCSTSGLGCSRSWRRSSLVTLAWLNQRATQKRMEIASSAMAAAHNSQQAAAVHGTTVRASA